jgi:uncharacterized protein
MTWRAGVSARAVTRFVSLLALLLLALAAPPLQAQPRLPGSAALVVDDAEVLSEDKEELLRDALLGFRRTQQRQVAVVTLRDLQGYDVADFGYLLGRRYGLGEPGGEDGAVLIVAPNDMKVWIEVGAGVRSALPEGAVDNIIETQVLPSFRQGDMDKGILNGVGTIFGYLELPHEQAVALAEQARLEQMRAEEADGFPWAGLAVLVLLLILWPIVRAVFGGFFGVLGTIALFGGGSGSSRGGGFGGFGGGGGGFNGGGASGRW